MHRLAAVVVALAIAGAACSSSGDAETIGAGGGVEDATTVAVGETATSAASDESADMAEDEAADEAAKGAAEATLLASVVGVEASGEGWALPPGRWTSPKLGTPISFTTTEPMAVVDNADGGIGIAFPDFSFEEFNSFLFASFIGVPLASVGDAEPEVLDLPEDLAAHFEEAEHIVVNDTGKVTAAGVEVDWLEIAADANSDDVFECHYGPACTEVLMHGAFGPFQIGDSSTFRFRIAELPMGPGSERLFIWVQASVAEFDNVWAAATAVLETLEFSGPETEDGAFDLAAGVPFAQVENGPLKAGTYSATIAGADVELSLAEDQADLVFEFAGPSFFIVSWIPAAMQDQEPDGQAPAFVLTEVIGFLTPEVSATEPGGLPPPEDVIAAGADLVEHFTEVPGITVRSSGTTVVGGLDATWTEIGTSDDISDDATFDCAGRFGPPGERCVEVLGGPGLGFVIYGGDVMRIYDIDGVDFHVVMQAGALNNAEAFEELTTILDGLTITP